MISDAKVPNLVHARGRLLAFSACLMLLVAFGVISGTAWIGKSATFDEPLHFATSWVQVHYDDFRCDPEDPPLWKYYVALGTRKGRLEIPTSGVVWDKMLTDRLAEGFFFRQIFYYTPGNDAVDALREARWRMVFLGMLVGGGIGWWAWRLGGPVAAILGVAAFSFDPNFLAHAALVKNDVPIALAMLAFMAAVWVVGERVTLLRCSALAVAMGVAMTVKFSGALAIPILMVALGARSLHSEPWRCGKWIARTRGWRMAIATGIILSACLFSYVFIWGCYRFRYAPGIDPNQTFDLSELLRISARHAAYAAYHAFDLSDQQLLEWNAHWKPGVLFRFVLWIGDHHLLPQAWVEGFLFTIGTAPGRDAFLLGTNAMNGRWYYFPVVMAVKTPVATLVAMLFAIVYCCARPAVFRRFWDCVALLLFPVVYLAVAMNSDLNLGVRHILPVYPFLFVLLGVVGADGIRRFRRPAVIVVGVLMLGLIVESCMAYPDYIPFFNVAAGGWRNGPNILGDSNVDWGQELPALADWQRDHPQYQLYLCYFGSADPRYYQIRYVKLPGGNGPADEVVPDSRPRVYALSATALQSPWLTPEVKSFYAGLKAEAPVAVLGHSIYLYNSR